MESADHSLERIGYELAVQTLSAMSAGSPAATLPATRCLEAIEAYVGQLETVIGHLHDIEREAQSRAKDLAVDEEAYRKHCIALRSEKTILSKELDETRDKFKDLKERLYAANLANQEMRGYIARIQEDDIVREPLIPTGDPNGEQQLVPKRKPTRFDRPSDYANNDRGDNRIYRERDGAGRPTPKHWISY